ncbi:hypothetical protein J2Y69_003359 [Microbacterium resistens]|uniref:Uncharacterized protein n=1 Tax=Microbacterium resistens TaxID=156977 RepID=A0ABU1SGK5_9MICO|nr:hypothetical protein [Microbacterium resistens]MDR6868735.1 hypothetical protein [Microbacterium resistens]
MTASAAVRDALTQARDNAQRTADSLALDINYHERELERLRDRRSRALNDLMDLEAELEGDS